MAESGVDSRVEMYRGLWFVSFSGCFVIRVACVIFKIGKCEGS